MADISVIEFILYGFLAYVSMLMLIISTVKEVPSGKNHSIVRVVFLTPGAIAALVLANSGINIDMETSTINNTIVNLNTTEVYTETIATTSNFVLQNPAWVTMHFLIFAVLIVYMITQVLILLTKVDDN